MRRNLHNAPRKQAGFTLIELLIASSVFSIILLLLTFGLLQIGKVYYSGLSSSQTQSVARSVSDTVSQAIQFSDGEITDPGGNTYCIGSKRLSYLPNKELKDGNALVLDATPSAGCAPLALSATSSIAGAHELLSSGMRVLNLKIEQVGTSNLYAVRIKIAKGADDLIVDQSGDTAKDNPPGSFNSAEGRCKGGAGGQFCAVSELYTQAQRRL